MNGVSRRGRVLLLVVCACMTGNAAAQSLRFNGDVNFDANRIKIRMDPNTPADVGAGDFTIDFWMKTAPGNNSPAVACGPNLNWIYGDIVLDRDRYGAGRAWGFSLGAGRPVWGVAGAGTSSNATHTLCAQTAVNDGRWRHIALQRRRSDGWMWIFVDGALAASVDGPDGDISYPNGASSSWPNDPYLVIGAEKHYTSTGWREFRGWIDEFRVSNILRWSGAFTPPQQPHAPDGNTVLLLHFDDGAGLIARDSSPSASDAALFYGGASNPGPLWSSDTPFSSTSAPPPAPAPAYRVSLQSAGFQNVPIHSAANGVLGPQIRLGGIPAFVFAGSASSLPSCDPGDVVQSATDGATWMRVVAPAVDDYNHGLAQNVSGYVRECEPI